MFLRLTYTVINAALKIIYWNTSVANTQFDAIMTEINLNENGYSLSEIRDGINASHTEIPIEKELLIENMGAMSVFYIRGTERILF